MIVLKEMEGFMSSTLARKSKRKGPGVEFFPSRSSIIAITRLIPTHSSSIIWTRYNAGLQPTQSSPAASESEPTLKDMSLWSTIIKDMGLKTRGSRAMQGSKVAENEFCSFIDGCKRPAGRNKSCASKHHWIVSSEPWTQHLGCFQPSVSTSGPQVWLVIAK